MQMRRRKRDDGGAAAVEFALILPIFLMLLFGIIDFGYMINRSSIINNAARDAVRVASVNGSGADVEAAANSTLNGVPNATLAVSCRKASGSPCAYGVSPVGNHASGDYATVSITYQHKMLTPVGIFVPGGFDLSRRAEMRIE